MAPFASSAVTPFNSLVTLVICYFLVSSNNALKTSQILTENANLHQELSVEKLLAMFNQLASTVQDQEKQIKYANNQITLMKEQIQRLESLLIDSNPSAYKSARNTNIFVQDIIRSAVFSPRTCQEGRDSGLPEFQESGMYWIDPDGLGIGDGAIYVHCDMSSGMTSVLHNSEMTIAIPKCNDPGCYSRDIVYQNATIKQMKALIDISETCEQSIQVNCVGGPFTIGDVNYAWWNDVDGKIQNFWSGSDDSTHICQCGIENDCIQPNLECNCDANVAVPLSDNGIVTLKEILPVTKLNFGDTKYEGGSHTLGKLKCSGKSVSNYPESCRDLWRAGHSLNGFYPIRQTNKVEVVYCNFALGQNVEETTIGYVDVKSQPVQFYVQSQTNNTQDPSNPNAAVQYDKILLNDGNGFGPTTGIFTAPRPGTYLFNFAGVDLPGNEELVVGLYKNGNLIGSFYAVNHGAAPIPSILRLAADDAIQMSIITPNGMLFGNPSNAFTHFTGVLLEEEIFLNLVAY